MNIKGTIRAISLNSVTCCLVFVLGLTTAYAQPSMKIKKNDNSYTNIKISEIDTITFGYAVGDTALGGVIIYVDATGWHGLVAAQTDESIGETYLMAWEEDNTLAIDFGAGADGLYVGETNTNNIYFYLQDGGIYAARYCRDKSYGGFTDWYLPSKYELNLMFEMRNVIGGFTNNVYWSSTSWSEWPESKSWAQFFYDGGYGNGYQFDGDQGQEFRVRAVRSF